MPMGVAVGQHPSATDEYSTSNLSSGVSAAQFNTPDLPGEHRWEYRDIRRLVTVSPPFGLTVEAIEKLPTHFRRKPHRTPTRKAGCGRLERRPRRDARPRCLQEPRAFVLTRTSDIAGISHRGIDGSCDAADAAITGEAVLHIPATLRTTAGPLRTADAGQRRFAGLARSHPRTRAE